MLTKTKASELDKIMSQSEVCSKVQQQAETEVMPSSSLVEVEVEVEVEVRVEVGVEPNKPVNLVTSTYLHTSLLTCMLACSLTFLYYIYAVPFHAIYWPNMANFKLHLYFPGWVGGNNQT